VSLRALVVALLLAGSGLWQAWSCSSGMMTSPAVATAMASVMSSAGHTGHSSAAQLPATDHGGPEAPVGMVAMCVSVLASLAAVLMVLTPPLKLLAIVRRLGDGVTLPALWRVRAQALAQLCVSRT
jgi:hypothetical protein